MVGKSLAGVKMGCIRLRRVESNTVWHMASDAPLLCNVFPIELYSIFNHTIVTKFGFRHGCNLCTFAAHI